MKLMYGTLGLIAFAIASCKMGAPKTGAIAAEKDTLSYTYAVFKQRAADCGSKPDSDCSVISFKYPVFKGRQMLNDTITGRLLLMFAQNDTISKSFSQLAKSILRDYENDKHDPQNPVYYTVDGYSKVLGQDSSLVTLETGGYSFTGGAHGASFDYFINWDTKANKIIALDDLFSAGYEDKLRDIGEQIFRKDEKLSDTASLANHYFFKDNKFVLNNNFSITHTGLRFIYNDYEIKSYAEGATALFIPWPQIKSLLRPNTVVSQYIK